MKEARHNWLMSLQVNINFSPKQFCASGLLTSDEKISTGLRVTQPVLYYASTLKELFRKIKATYNIPRENVTLTFQPDGE